MITVREANKELVAEMKAIEKQFDTKFAGMDTKFDAKFGSLEKTLAILLWVIGIIGTLMVALKFIK